MPPFIFINFSKYPLRGYDRHQSLNQPWNKKVIMNRVDTLSKAFGVFFTSPQAKEEINSDAGSEPESETETVASSTRSFRTTKIDNDSPPPRRGKFFGLSKKFVNTSSAFGLSLSKSLKSSLSEIETVASSTHSSRTTKIDDDSPRSHRSKPLGSKEPFDTSAAFSISLGKSLLTGGLGTLKMRRIASLDDSSDEEIESQLSKPMSKRSTFARSSSEISPRSHLTLNSSGLFGSKERKPEKGALPDVYLRAPDCWEEGHQGDAYIHSEASTQSSCTATVALFAPSKIPPKSVAKRVRIFHQYRDQIVGAGERIGLTVYMNGILVNELSFKEYGRTIYKKIGERTAVVGLHNPTYGVTLDVAGLVAKCLKIFSGPIYTMQEFLKALTHHFYADGPRMKCLNARSLCLIVVHSEGGLILHRALHDLAREVHYVLRKHLVIITLGAVHPVPHRYGKDVINYYSERDYAANPFAMRFFKDADYNIKVLSCQTKKPIDHGFLDKTYQRALADRVSHLAQTFGFGKT